MTLRNGAWKPLAVSLTNNASDLNHYDHDDHAATAAADLEAGPHEPVGIFFGLEVLDASQYRITKDGRFEEVAVKTNEKGKSLKIKKDCLDGIRDESTKKKRKRKRGKSNDDERDVGEHDEVSPHHYDKGLVAEVDSDTGANALNNNKSIKKNNTEKTRDKKGRHTKEKSVKNGSKKNNESAVHTSSDEPSASSQPMTGISNPDLVSLDVLRHRWMDATGIWLESDVLCTALWKQSFLAPTPIQAATLAAASAQHNIVGAAPTGSGKTLAFLLPIAMHLVKNASVSKNLQALILTPTRELALQIHRQALHFTKSVGCFTGGLAVAKQQRVLQQRPSIVVATPGRLWQLLSSKDHDHLNDLSCLKYLVIDEADRLLVPGSGFPQLERILEAVHQANPMLSEDEDNDDNDDDSDLENDDIDRMRSLPGLPGEARVAMLTPELLKHLQTQNNDEQPTPCELADTDFEQELLNGDKSLNQKVVAADAVLALAPVVRQTFIFSATLTLPMQSLSSKKKAFKSAVSGVVGAILERAYAKGKTKVVDLTTTESGGGKIKTRIALSSQEVDVKKSKESSTSKSAFSLPDGLQLRYMRCTQLHKDSHLYAYLMTVVDAKGPALVFCNSIAGVRRVGGVLQTLGLSVRLLHAQMQQRARFKAVESLSRDKQEGERIVVVATDVAARGLDIPSVATVIHYDVARTLDTFVHRSGRTARGVGEDAVGCSLSLVSSAEDKYHAKIVSSLQVQFGTVALDGRLLTAAQERVQLATKVAMADDTLRKSVRDHQWFKEQAEEAGLEFDEGDDQFILLQDKDAPRERAQRSEAEIARQKLRKLLEQPIQTQRYGKFLRPGAIRRIEPIPQRNHQSHAKKKKMRKTK